MALDLPFRLLAEQRGLFLYRLGLLFRVRFRVSMRECLGLGVRGLGLIYIGFRVHYAYLCSFCWCVLEASFNVFMFGDSHAHKPTSNL